MPENILAFRVGSPNISSSVHEQVEPSRDGFVGLPVSFSQENDDGQQRQSGGNRTSERRRAQPRHGFHGGGALYTPPGWIAAGSGRSLANPDQARSRPFIGQAHPSGAVHLFAGSVRPQ